MIKIINFYLKFISLELNVYFIYKYFFNLIILINWNLEFFYFLK